VQHECNENQYSLQGIIRSFTGQWKNGKTGVDSGVQQTIKTGICSGKTQQFVSTKLLFC